MSDDHDHATLPVRIPDLTHLSNDELSALRSKIGGAIKEARRKSNAAIQKYPQLKDPWFKSMSVRGDDPERLDILRRFERELLRVPEAYLAYAYVTSLFVMDGAIREEMLRRSMEPKSGKKKGVAPAPPPPEEKTIDVLSAIEAIEATENAP